MHLQHYEPSATLGRQWRLGPLASCMTKPFEAQAACILHDRALEAWFLTASWVQQHSMLAILDHPSIRAEGLSETLAAQIRSELWCARPIDVVSRWFGGPIRGLKRSFNRLANSRASRTGTYEALIRILLQDGRGAAIVRQTNDLSFQHIDALAAAPDWFRTDALRRLEPRVARRLGLIAAELVSSGSAESLDKIRKLSSHDLSYGLPVALVKLGFEMPFPPSREPTDTRLQRIKSAAELFEIASRFENCLSDYLAEGLSGSRAYYVWNGEETAIVEAIRIVDDCWIVNIVLGPFNMPVSNITDELIRKLFSDNDVAHDIENLTTPNGVQNGRPL